MQKSTAKLFRSGDRQRHVGTAWLCARDFAITAAHCVGDVKEKRLWPGPFHLIFAAGTLVEEEEETCDASIVEVNWEWDAALLFVAGCGPGRPVVVAELPPIEPWDTSRRWTAWGFPHAKPTGLTLHGTIINPKGRYENREAIELRCEVGGFDNLHGASGAAVLFDNTVIGIITSSVLQDLVVYARSLASIRRDSSRFGDVLAGRLADEAEADTTFPEFVNPIGRDLELEALVKCFREENARALTLTGPPGIGKTTLGVEAAKRLRPYFPGGIYYVDLRSLSMAGQSFKAATEAEVVIQKIAEKLGVRQGANTILRDNIVSALRDKHALLMFDNFEYLLTAGSLVAFLLQSCPRLHCIITSQILLSGDMQLYERNFVVKGLDTPSDCDDLEELRGNPAVQVFMAQAKQVTPDFALTMKNAGQVAELCRYVGGLPLAIRLVAAQVKAAQPKEILEWWRDGRRPGLGPLDQAFGLSYKRLAPSDARVFRLLSVFAGGCRRGTAEELFGGLGDINEALTSLVHNSLLETEVEFDGTTRFRMLQTIRDYALRQLRSETESEAKGAWTQFQNWYMKLVEDKAPRLTDARRDQDRCVELLSAEEDNLRVVLRSNLGENGDPEMALKLSGLLFWFWNFTGNFAEGVTWLNEALQAAGTADTAPRARALYALGGLYFLRSDYRRAGDTIRESVRIWEVLDDKRGLAYALIILGMVELFYNPDPESAVKHQRRSRHLMAEVRDDWGYALATTDLARAVTLIEGYTAARELFEQSLTKWEEMGDNWGIPLSLSAWAEAALRHEPKQAEQNLERALAIQTNVGDRWGEAVTLALWGELRVNRKEFADGEKQLRRSLELHQQLGRKELIADCLECLAVAALGRGSPVRAGFLFGATEKLRKETGVCSPDKRGGHRDADIAASRQAAEQDGTAQDFERQFSLGKNSDIGSACAFALAP